MQRFIAWCAMFYLLGAIGCTRNHYVIEITPVEDGFQRQLTAWSESTDDDDIANVTSLSEDELKPMRAAYSGKTMRRKGKKHIFSGKFRETIPDDLGGAGSCRQFESPLGTLGIYVERLRGRDDIEQRLAEQRGKADELIDLFMGWADVELTTQPLRSRAKQLLDEDVRRDLGNLISYLWAYQVVSEFDSDSDSGTAFLVRVGQYLAERDYFSAADIPHLYHAMENGSPEESAALIQRVVVRKLGVKEGSPIPEQLEFLADPKRVERSLSTYLAGTMFYQQRLAQWKKSHAEEVAAGKEGPEPLDVLGDHVVEACFGAPFSTQDAIEIRLHVPIEPFKTDGKWNAKKKMVEWDKQDSDQRAMPIVVNASWSRPNGRMQKRHFGQVLLEDEDLGRFVLWYQALPAKEKGEWDRFVNGLEPGRDLESKIKAFHFSEYPENVAHADGDEEDAEWDRADPARNLLLGRLEKG